MREENNEETLEDLNLYPLNLVCRVFIIHSFWHKACGISAPQPEIKLRPPALEGEVLTIGPPGKSWEQLDFKVLNTFLTVVVLVSNFINNSMGL